jgi:hypothetical protein
MVLLCRKESPGFLDYFIIGEHYKRFVVGQDGTEIDKNLKHNL